MAHLTRCDVCRLVVDRSERDEGWVAFEIRRDWFELCPSCHRDLRKFLEPITLANSKEEV